VADLRARAPDAPVRSTFTEPSFAFLTGGDLTLTSPEEIVALAPDPSAAAIYVLDGARWSEGAEGLEAEEIRAAQFQTLMGAACAFETVEGVNYSRGDATSLFVLLTGCPPTPAPEGDVP